MLGHSLDVTTTAGLMLEDKRIDAGVGMDGAYPLPEFLHTASLASSVQRIIATSIPRPFSLFRAPGPPTRNPSDQNELNKWFDKFFIQYLSGWKRELFINNTAHASFSDYQLLVDMWDIRKNLLNYVRDALGDMRGVRMVDILSFDLKLRGRGTEELLDRNYTEWPEVEIVR